MLNLKVSKEIYFFTLYLDNGNYLQVKAEKDVSNIYIMFAVILNPKGNRKNSEVLLGSQKDLLHL